MFLSLLLVSFLQEIEKPMHTNRLAKEKSPYLLQHAQNPVDWYAWGSEAFEKAKKEEKPIFLSVGYSTCHWCHVMERESFENADVAEVLNKYFVSIKVDREERPDVDRMYMTFVQATTGAGGWPMSVWLTPDLKPFYGGTYFPPESRWGRPGFREVLMTIAQKWEKERDHVLQSGNQVTEALRQYIANRGESAGKRDESLLKHAYEQFERNYDDRRGGFGDAPKFPRPVVYNFLLRYYARTGTRHALDMTLHTLREMAKGGMYDQLGGGFHRYSTDERWHVPHFEKMLYDQAQLVISYVEAFQITGEAQYANVARDVLEYVLRDMTSPDGAFYSAEDADSVIDPAHPHEKGEGAYFIWSKDEIEKALGKERAEIFNFRYGVAENGNALNDPQGEFTGKNILFQAQTVQATAAMLKKDKASVETAIEESKAILLKLRAKRVRPHLDDKVLSAWNGMMISAFAKASQALSEKRYLDAAERAANFLASKMRDPKTGNWLRRYRDESADIQAFGDDYAFMIQGMLDLYEASFNTKWLQLALDLATEQKKRLWDETTGGFFDSAGDDSSILIRSKEHYDGAEPSPNSVATLNLLRLAEITDNAEWQKMATQSLSFFTGSMEKMAQAVPQMLVALDFSLSKAKQIVIAGTPSSSDTQQLLQTLNKTFVPNKVVLLTEGGEKQSSLAKIAPFAAQMKMLGGKATAYVCENYACKAPTTDPKTFAESLK